MTLRTKMQDIEHAKAVAREVTQSQRKTCEGCALLRIYPRPMCSGEQSPHFRTARDTYHPRCQWFSVRGSDGKPAPVAQPEPPAPQPARKKMKLVRVRGSDRVVSEAEYDQLMARKRRVGA